MLTTLSQNLTASMKLVNAEGDANSFCKASR